MTSTINEQTFISPFLRFQKENWKTFNSQYNHNIAADDLKYLHAMGEPLNIAEIEDIYFPLASLLEIQIEYYKKLHNDNKDFFGVRNTPLPFIIGIAGSVAVGKSTTARVLKRVLSHLPGKPKVELVTTDGFLYPNEELIHRGILNRKGFPESYNTKLLLSFLSEMKSGNNECEIPIYSHLEYDILPDKTQKIDHPDILIVEGINVLQVNSQQQSGHGVFVSDFFDYSIYVDAEEQDIVNWYIERFESLRATAFQNPDSYFNKYANMTSEESKAMASSIWNEINKPNLLDNILPTRYRANLILKKDANHFVKEVLVRRI